MKLLVVDDNRTAREVLQETLCGFGHEVVTAGDGFAALEEMERRSFDLVVTDVTMPRMDGLRLCEEIRGRAALRDVALIVYSGNGRDEANEERARCLGVARFLGKPVDAEQLAAVVGEVLRDHDAERADRAAPEAAGDARAHESLRARVRELEDEAQRLRGELARAGCAAVELPATGESLRGYMDASLGGVWRFEVDPPVPVNAPEDEQVVAILERGRVTECNLAFAFQYGNERVEEVVGLRPADLWGDDPGRRETFARQFIRSGYQIANGEILGRDREGRRFVALHNLFGVVQGGRLTGGWGTQRDITEQKRADEAVRESEARFRFLVENLSDVVMVLDSTGVVRYLSPSIEEHSGFKAEELLGTDALAFLHPDDQPRGRELMAAALRRPGTVSPVIEVRSRDKRGAWRWMQVVGKSLMDGAGQLTILAGFRDVTARRSAEAALRQSEERLRRLFDHASFGIFEASTGGRLTHVNAAFARMFGYQAPETAVAAIGDNPDWFWVRPELRDEVIATALASDGAVRREVELRRHDGSQFHALLDLKAARGADGSPSHVEGFVEEITERREVETQLRTSLEFLDRIINRIADPIFVKDEQFRLVLVNDAECAFAGRPRGELLGRTDYDLLDARYADVFRQQDIGVFETGQENFSEESLPDAGGRICTMVTRKALLTDQSGRRFVVGIMRDVTARRRVEERMITLATAVEQVADDIAIIGPDGRIRYVNSAFERTSGYTSAEIVGQPSLPFVGDDADGRLQDAILECLRSDRVWQGRLVNRARDGRQVLLDVSISPIRDAAERVVGYVSARRDVTNQVHLEERVARVQRLEAIGTLAGGIAHDFNNLLSVIVGFTQMALRKCPAESGIVGDLQAVLQGARRATDLVKQIMAFSRQERREEQPVQVGLIVKEAAKFLRATIPSTVDLRTDVRTESIVLADPTEIHRIVVNLCTNGALALQEHGGLLEVSLADVDLDAAFAASHPGVVPGPFVRLRVRDTGCGMTREVMARIFEPFFTTREQGKGTGMGLAVVHGIATRCGGAIDVASEVGKGTTFEIYLPGLRRSAPADEPDGTVPLYGTGRVLLVDDEPLVADSLVEMLRALGYEVRLRTNGPEALAAFEADPQAVDLVITDMTMPGMTGDVLGQRIKGIRPDVPVILCTGFSEKVTAESARAMGIDDFVMKPVLMADLSRRIRRALERA